MILYASPMRLDHVSYAVSHSELTDTVQRLGALLGASFYDGGRHPSFGTSNFVLPLVEGKYIEIVAALDHPAADRAPFGQAVRQRAEAGGGWLGWVVACDDISAVESRLGRTAVPGHRRLPDGFDLRWKQIGVMDNIANPQLPFFIEWETSEDHHPSLWGHSVTLKSIAIAGDQQMVTEYLGSPKNNPLDDVEVQWVEAEEPGIVSVTFDTPNGIVVLD